MNETEDIYVMKTVMNETRDICETKTINDFSEKFVVSVTRQNPNPHIDHPTHPVTILVAREGLVGGARARPVMGAPGGGGVLRCGFARALTSTY